MSDHDELVEAIASGIEQGSFADIMGVLAKRKRDREDADLRYRTRKEQQAEIARYVRSFKRDHGNDPAVVLKRIAAQSDHPDLLLRHAWPLAKRGLCEIQISINPCPNSLPHRFDCTRIELTDKGRAMLTAISPADHKTEE